MASNTPSDQWNTYALLDEWGKTHSPEVGDLIAKRLQSIIHQQQQSFIVASDDGHWGRGDTLKDAAKEARRAGASTKAVIIGFMIINDREAYVDDNGSVNAAPGSEIFRLGILGKLRTLSTI